MRDPVTGRTRELSNQPGHELRVAFRQNLTGANWAWGGMIATVSDAPCFGIDEFLANHNIADTIDMDIFVETTRWFACVPDCRQATRSTGRSCVTGGYAAVLVNWRP